MKQIVIGSLVMGAAALLSAAPPAPDLFVPVNLDDFANHSAGAKFSGPSLTVGGVPFNSVTKPGVDNLFLKSASWPDLLPEAAPTKKNPNAITPGDPTSSYAPYDFPPKPGDPRRPTFTVPMADYSAVYLLAATDNDLTFGDVVSLRIGIFQGSGKLIQHYFSAVVPRFQEKQAPAGMTLVPNPAGNLFVIRVPLGVTFGQEFKGRSAEEPKVDADADASKADEAKADESEADKPKGKKGKGKGGGGKGGGGGPRAITELHVELTKELRLAIHSPDACRFQIRPLGLPSGVHIFGMTFVRSPLAMEVTSDEAAHVFNEPQTPKFHVNLHGSGGGKLSLEAVETDFYGNTSKVNVDNVKIPATGSLVQDVTVPVKQRGYHSLVVRLLDGGNELLRHETTFALLPPDTRKHRAESPFGTWDFSGVHGTPNDPNLVGPLYVKAGLRYGMFFFPAEDRKKWGVLAGTESPSPKALANALSKDPLYPKHVMIFHEHAISGAHVMRTPDVFTGRPPYKLDEKEEPKFQKMFAQATAVATETRKTFPDAKLALGNGNPQLLEEFLRHKFPKELFDSRGNEAGSKMRMPEAQPFDFSGNNSSLWMDRQILDHYGYNDKPVTQCYEICYPGTNPGQLTLRTQAIYFIRHIMHSLAWGVPVIRPGLITDTGSSYYHSGWGSAGFCFGLPNVSPKPAYVAIATMTQALDGAKFTRAVPTGSSVVYAVEFKKAEGGFVTVLWTLRGTRKLSLQSGDTRGTLTDIMGTGQAVAFAGGKGEIEVTDAPVFLATSQPLTISIASAPMKMESRPDKETKSFLISSVGKLSDWQVESGNNQELEWFNFDCPRRKGNFTFEDVGSFEGESGVLKVTPHLPVPGSSYLPMYSVLSHKEGVAIPGTPTEIGLMINGNGSWGRVIFELEDAGGQRWTSIGAQVGAEKSHYMTDWMSTEELAQMKTISQCDWNSNDTWQKSRINFEGWRYVKFPLPGNYPGENYHWPYGCNWKCTGKGVVQYPLKFKKLIIELPEKTLYLTSYAPVPRPEIYLKDLMVTYRPPEQALVAE